MRLDGLPDDVTSLASCSSIGDATLIDGWLIDEAHWVTRDGSSVDELTMGEQGDVFGPVTATAGGFAAAGFDLDDGRAQPVGWLSPDGRQWEPVAVPTKNWVASARVDLWASVSSSRCHDRTAPARSSSMNLADLLSPRR